MVGASRRWHQENAQRLRVFVSGSIGILPFEENYAAIAGDIRAALVANRTANGPYDLLIADQALRTGTTLATAAIAGEGSGSPLPLARRPQFRFPNFLFAQRRLENRTRHGAINPMSAVNQNDGSGTVDAAIEKSSAYAGAEPATKRSM